MKRGLVFGIILGFLLVVNLGFVSAACINNNDIIMKLSSATNAHGALWNDANYNYDICYSNFFTGTPAIPHPTCDENNAILWLSSITNAHASLNKIIGDYETPVCYGDLTCIADSSAVDICSDTSSKIIARLFNETNSHISNASDTNYPIKICCKTGAAPPSDVYWANMEGVPITQAQINDTVMLVYEDASAGNYFEIYEDDGASGDDDIKTGNNKLNSGLRDGKSIATWKITDEDYEKAWAGLETKASELAELPIGHTEFYFKVNGNDALISSNLNVSATPDNTAPSVTIIKPILESKHLIEADIAFEQIAADPDDALELVWEFGDGNTTTIENIQTTGNGNTTHVYDSTGVKEILATVKEMTREQEASDRSRVLIYDEGVHAYALIDSPLPDVPYSAKRVAITANRSFVANCTTSSSMCSSTATHWNAGSCYSVTGSLSGTPLAPLSCFDYPTARTLIGYDLFFEWTFDIGKIYESKRAGLWSLNYDDVVESYKIFSREGKHDIELIMGYKFD